MRKYIGTNIWLALWLLTIVAPSYGRRKDCSPVSLDDVYDAVKASSAAYKDVGVDAMIPNSTFKVVNLTNPSFSLDNALPDFVNTIFKKLDMHQVSLKAIVATSGSTTIISFRGTKGTKQLLQEGGSFLDAMHTLPYAGKKKMRVLEFFWKAFEALSPDALVPGGIQSGRKYIITGHSLGGALGSLYALHLAKNYPDVWNDSQSSLITFGQPRVGDKKYAREHDDLISKDRKLRFIYKRDVVSDVPKKGDYQHHSREVWLSETSRWNVVAHAWGNTEVCWTVCGKGDSPEFCSVSKSSHGTYDHEMDDDYLLNVLEVPDIYYDKRQKERTSFIDAQCQ